MRGRHGLTNVLLGSALAWTASAWAAGAAPTTAPGWSPVIERAPKGEACVDDTATMRRDHMKMLRHQRDDTVHGGIRGAAHSLKGCIDCHASPTTGSVAKAPTDFCVSCHAYAAVKIDCFECHASTPTGGTGQSFHHGLGDRSQTAATLDLRRRIATMSTTTPPTPRGKEGG